MKIGIISFAHMHAASYAKGLGNHPQAELTCIWDDNPERGQQMAQVYNCRFIGNLDQFLQEDIDAVIVCSENARHKEHVIAAATAGKHILCEKPIATETADAVEMIETCKREGVLFQIAFPVRFSTPVMEMKNMVQSGQLGDIIGINATNHGQNPGGWFVDRALSGGGAAMDHIVHVMDVVRWVFQDEVERVYAELDTRYSDIEPEDCGIVLLELQSGICMSIDPSWSRPRKSFPTWGDVTMEIVGSNGSLSLDAFKQHTLYYSEETGNVQQLSWADDMDQGLINDFIQSVQEKRAPSISGTDGLRTLEVVKAAYESNEKHEFVPVQLNAV